MTASPDPSRWMLSSRVTQRCTEWVCVNEFNFRWANRVKIRSCKYLNNIVGQDHRQIKSRIPPMLGFKKFYNARRVLIGVELLQKLRN